MMTAHIDDPSLPSDSTLSRESEVRLYSRYFPATFAHAVGARLETDDGRQFIDFFCGAGSVNYGHNPPTMQRALIQFIEQDALVQAIDMDTPARSHLLGRIDNVLLAPRGLDYKVQFCGPTGTNAIEAALMLARRVTGRAGLVAFTGSFHGMSAGSMSVSGTRSQMRKTARIPGVTFMPYCDGPAGWFDSIELLDRMLDDSYRGMEFPAAVVVEAVQLEAGVYPASVDWLRALRRVTTEHDVLLICDEIQTGCGRTGPFFAFERAGVEPDIVAMSKSFSGYGLPLSLILFKPQLDIWAPGDFTGTFRGSQLAFVTAAVALDMWTDSSFVDQMDRNAERLAEIGASLAALPELAVRCAGMALGVDFGASAGRVATAVQRRCFENGLLVECCGRHGEVVKIMPPLNIDPPAFKAGIDALEDAIEHGARAMRRSGVIA